MAVQISESSSNAQAGVCSILKGWNPGFDDVAL